MSHLLTIKTEIKDMEALASAVEALGGHVLGMGKYLVYTQWVEGLGIRLPGWYYPVVLKEDGSLAFDNDRGRWGDPARLDELRSRYTIEAARLAATRLGWVSEVQPDGKLVIYHPDGGTLTVEDGTLDAAGFQGASCANATEAIAAALGAVGTEIRKPEWNQEVVPIKQIS